MHLISGRQLDMNHHINKVVGSYAIWPVPFFFKKKEVAYLLDGFKFSWVHHLWLQLTSLKKPVIVLMYTEDFFFLVRFLNEYENQAGTVAHFLGFMNLGLALSLDHARFTPIDTWKKPGSDPKTSQP